MSSDGATPNERLLAAAKEDNETMLVEIFESEEGNFDINHQDGLGNTALHYAVKYASMDVLEHILSHEKCDVDPINRLDKATPLHLAAQLEDEDERNFVVESLLDAGADVTIKDKNGDTVVDLLRADDDGLRALIRKSQAQASFSHSDIVDEDDDDELGSGSGSESD